MALAFLSLLPTPPQPVSGGHDGDSLGVDGAQVGVLKEPHQVDFACLLQCPDGGALEPGGLKVLCDLPDQLLEWQFAYQQFIMLLILNFSL